MQTRVVRITEWREFDELFSSHKTIYGYKSWIFRGQAFVDFYCPQLRNERLINQQGVLTVQNVVDAPLEIVLESHCENDSDQDKGAVKFVFVNDEVHFDKYISILHRMNISNASLFPDLSGLSRSLRPQLMNISSRF